MDSMVEVFLESVFMNFFVPQLKPSYSCRLEDGQGEHDD